MDKFDVYYFSGTHWDREWYQNFQGFRYRLVKMTDKLLKLFEENKDFKTFHFDGQTIVLEDYLEIRPENREKIEKYTRDGKLLIGPWYVMPDEFLVSGESLIRNLMIGHKLCEKYKTEPWKFGYICDIFGHIAQMPQIFKGFSIDYALLGRGLLEDAPQFFKWTSPDGSSVTTYALNPDNGYGNFRLNVYSGADRVEPISDENILREKIKAYIDKEMNRSDIPIAIAMDALDHCEASPNTVKYMNIIRELYPKAEVHHCDLREAMKKASGYELPEIAGELNKTNRSTRGFLHLITNTLSSYYTLKKKNDECQNMLEKEMEPLAVLSDFEGIESDRAYINLAYKYLIQNHPHDSICGCSIDSVHKDMEYRFNQTAELLANLRFDFLVKSGKYEKDGKEHILTLYNTLPYEIERVVTVGLDFEPGYPAVFQEPFGYELKNSFRIFDSEGNEIPYDLTDIKRNYRKRLFDQFTGNFDVHTVSFKAKLPAMGKAEYKVVPSEAPSRYFNKMKSGDDYAENEFIRLTILSDGSLEIYDKPTGKTYRNLGVLADDGEIGDGWFHANPVNDSTVTSKGGRCVIEKIQNGAARCVFKITRFLEVPAHIETTKFGQMRSRERTVLKIEEYVSLNENARFAEIKLSFDNTAKDHRLRLKMESGVPGDKYFSGQAFCYVERNSGIDKSTESWIEPEQYEKSTNGIFGKRDEEGNGIAFVSAKGLHECACFDDEKSTLAVTLLRSFSKTVMTNSETNCQLNCPLEYEFLFVPLDKSVEYKELLKLQDMAAVSPLVTFGKAESKTAPKSPVSYIEIENASCSIIKKSEDGSGIIIRLFNPSDKKIKAVIKTKFEFKNVCETNLNEEFLRSLDLAAKNRLEIDLPPFKIITVKSER